MKLIRQETFETNSSSTHSVTVVSKRTLSETDIEKSLDILLCQRRIGSSEITIDLDARLTKDISYLDCRCPVVVKGRDHNTSLEIVDMETSPTTYFGFGDTVGKLIMVLAAYMSEDEVEFLEAMESESDPVYVRDSKELVFTFRKYCWEDRPYSEDLKTLMSIMHSLADRFKMNIVFRLKRSEEFSDMAVALEELRYILYAPEYFNPREYLTKNFILDPNAYLVSTITED